MARNESQAATLIEKLTTRTLSGTIRWESSIEPRRYQARMGDFILQIGPDIDGTQLVVRKLSGAIIDTLSSSNMVSISMLGRQAPRESLSADNKAKLEELYAIIDGTNDELAELINML